jgi:hypothetical protein
MSADRFRRHIRIPGHHSFIPRNVVHSFIVAEGFAAFQRVTAASKEENAIVERANKEVNRHLRAFVFDIAFSVRWLFGLPMTERIINTMVHSVSASHLPSWFLHCMPTWTEGYCSIGHHPMIRQRPIHLHARTPS